MKYIRFLDPAGSMKEGKLTEKGVTFGNEFYDMQEIKVLPPALPTKIVCVGLNYKDHAEETESELPERPLLFLKGPNAVAAHGSTIKLPKGKERVDYEAELGVVIGTQCRNVSKTNAMNFVKGFTCFNDVSNRDDQRIEENWIRGKAFDNAAPIGPVIASADEVPDDANIQLRLNGELKQDSSRDQLIFTVPELIAEITSYMTLEPGDIIATGTPSGIGPLSDGDTVEITIEGIGTLKHYVKKNK